MATLLEVKPMRAPEKKGVFNDPLSEDWRDY